MSDRVRAPLIALAASLGLIGTYLAFGGATYDPADVADPCETRDVAVLQDRSLFEAIALSSLDGAACELQVSREELTLALADEEATDDFAAAHGIDPQAVEDAVRAGLVRSVDDAIAAGELDGFDAELLREVAERVTGRAGHRRPPGAVSDDDSVQGLLELLGSLEGLELPGIGDIPGADELGELLP